MPPLVNSPGTKISQTYLNVVLRVSGFRVCVFYTLNIISIVEMLWYGCFKGFTSYLRHSQENPYSSSSFPFLNLLPCIGIANYTTSRGNQIIYVLNHQASYRNKVETKGI